MNFNYIFIILIQLTNRLAVENISYIDLVSYATGGAVCFWIGLCLGANLLIDLSRAAIIGAIKGSGFKTLYLHIYVQNILALVDPKVIQQ